MALERRGVNEGPPSRGSQPSGLCGPRRPGPGCADTFRPPAPVCEQQEALVISRWPGMRTVPSPRLATATASSRGGGGGAGGPAAASRADTRSRARGPRPPCRREPGQSLASTNAHLSPGNTVGRKSQSELKAPGSGRDRGRRGAGAEAAAAAGRSRRPGSPAGGRASSPSSTQTRGSRSATLPERRT